MANAKKCDRCGTFYESNTRYPRTVACVKTAIGGVHMTTSYGHSVDYMDLCDECLTKLGLFLSGDELATDVE